MAYKEVSRVEITEVIRQWQAGRGIREITRSTGLSRNTIRKYILTAQSCSLARDGPPPTESQLITLVQLNRAGPREVVIPTDKVLEPWAEQIEQWLKHDRLKLTRIQELLAQHRCLVAYTCLRRYVMRRGWMGKGSHTTVRMADTEPGQMAEVDFGRLGLTWDPESGRRRLASGMLTVMGYSRHSFLWPLFAQSGKESVLVRQILSHTAGLPALDTPVPMETLYDWNKVVSMLAAQKTWWEPGKEWGYHAFTWGHLVGEIVRRITGKTLGTFFRDEVAVPLGADFHIGLPEEHEKRVGEMTQMPEFKPGDPNYIAPGSMLYRAMNFPIFSAIVSRKRAFRAGEGPASNGHGNARSVARVTAAVACGGELDGVRLFGLPTIHKALEEQYYGTPQSWLMPIRFGLGFGLTSKEMPIGPNPRVLYWGGYGGSLVVMDLDAKLSYSYVMNKMGGTPNPRSVPIIGALYQSLYS